MAYTAAIFVFLALNCVLVTSAPLDAPNSEQEIEKELFDFLQELDSKSESNEVLPGELVICENCDEYTRKKRKIIPENTEKPEIPEAPVEVNVSVPEIPDSADYSESEEDYDGVVKEIPYNEGNHCPKGYRDIASRCVPY